MIKETLCEHCVFKQLDVSGKQIGCDLNRLDKFETEDRGNFKVVKNYCSACRNIYWKSALGLTQKFDMIEMVKKEIRLTYDIVLDIRDKNLDELKLSINKIQSMKFKPEKVWILLGTNKDCISIASQVSKMYEFILTLDDSTQYKTIASCINRSKASHIMFTCVGLNFGEEVVEMFEKALNEDIKPLATHSDDNLFFCPIFIYKHFMHDENPFESINEYVKSIAARKCSDS